MAELGVEKGKIIIRTSKGKTIRTGVAVQPGSSDFWLLWSARKAIDEAAEGEKGTELGYEIQNARISLQALRRYAGPPGRGTSARAMLSGEMLILKAPVGAEGKMLELARTHMTDYDVLRERLEESEKKEPKVKGERNRFYLWVEQTDTIRMMKEFDSSIPPSDAELAQRIIEAVGEAADKAGEEKRWDTEHVRIPFDSIKLRMQKSSAKREGFGKGEKIGAEFHIEEGMLLVSIGGGKPKRTGIAVKPGIRWHALNEKMIYALAEVGLRGKSLMEKEKIAGIEITQEQIERIKSQLSEGIPRYYVANISAKKSGKASYLIYELTPPWLREVQQLDMQIKRSKGLEKRELMSKKRKILEQRPGTWTMPLERKFKVGEDISQREYIELPLQIRIAKRKKKKVVG